MLKVTPLMKERAGHKQERHQQERDCPRAMRGLESVHAALDSGSSLLGIP